MAVENPFGGGPQTTAQGASPPPVGKVVNPFTTAATAGGQAIHAVNPFDAGDSPSIGGFFGNILGGVKDMALGVTNLIGQGLHDIVQLARGPGAMKEENFQLWQTFKGLTGIGPGPSALLEDYQSRYGWDDFSHGDIWGGLKSLATGFYDNPIAYVGDALIVGAAAGKAGQLGLLGETAGTKVLGGVSPAAVKAGVKPTFLAESMTGGETALAMSKNPVTRFGQNQIFSHLFSYAPEKALKWAELRNPVTGAAAVQDVGGYNRAMTALSVAESRGVKVLRPTASKMLENRFTSRALSSTGVAVQDRSSRLAQEAITYINDLDEAEVAIFPDVAQGTMPTVAPSAKASSKMSIDPELEALLAGPTPTVTAVKDYEFIKALSKTYKYNNKTGRAFYILDPNSKTSPILAPHDRIGVPGTRIVVNSADAALRDAPEILRTIERETGYKLVNVKNYFADSGSYEGYHGFFRGRDGQINEVSISNPILAHEQAKWGGVSRKIDDLRAQLDNPELDPAAAVKLTDELQAAEAYNNYSFSFTRRKQLESLGAPYAKVAQSSDAIRAITHQGATKIELQHGLTFRTIWDRAFLPKRATAHGELMTTLEQRLATIFNDTIVGGGKAIDSLDATIAAIDEVLGAGHPATARLLTELKFREQIGNALTRSQVDEVIPFSVEQTLPGGAAQLGAGSARQQVAQAMEPHVFGAGAQSAAKRAALDRYVKTGVWDDAAFGETQAAWFARARIPRDVREAATPAVDEAAIFQAGKAAGKTTPEILDEIARAKFPPREIGGGIETSGTLATGEKTILSDNGWWGPAGQTDTAAAARYVTNKIRRLTRESIVETGEFPGFTWKEMLADAEADPLAEIPQYFPHIKKSAFQAANVWFRNKQSNLESETGRMAKNEAQLFDSGMYQRDPIQAYSRLYEQVAKHDEYRGLLETMIAKYGREPTKEELESVALGHLPTGEMYVSRGQIDALIGARKNFMELKHDGMMAGLSPETATMEAIQEMSEAALASVAEKLALGQAIPDEIWAIPNHVAKLMDRAGRNYIQIPAKASFFWKTGLNAWKTSVLGLSPRWLVNNTLGNLVYMGVKNPAAIRRYIEMLMPSRRAYAEAMFGDSVPASVYKDFMHGERGSLLSTAETAEQAGLIGTAKKLESISQSRARWLINPTKWTSNKIYQLNGWNEQAARMGMAISAAEKQAMIGWMGRLDSTWGAMRRIVDSGVIHEGRLSSLAGQVNAVLGDYLRMSPMEKMVKQYLMPFYPFYRHTAMFIARMPFENPIKFEILRNIEELDKEMRPGLPDYMRGAYEIAPGFWARAGAANPLQAVTEAYGPSLTNPLLSLAVQRMTGTNPFGQPWFDPSQMVETGGGAQYQIKYNPDGSFAGVEPITGTWQPPLATTVLGMIPQFGLLTGITPFKNKSLPFRAAGFTGVSLSTGKTSQQYAYESAVGQAEATLAGARNAVRYG